MLELTQNIIIAEGTSIRLAEAYFNFKDGAVQISTEILDNDGKVIKTIVDKYYGEESNNYWANFTDTKSMYEMAIAKNNLSVDTTLVDDVPDTVFVEDTTPLEPTPEIVEATE